MRIAIVSDIHGNLPALEAVLAEAAVAGTEAIVNLGDILSGPLWPAETADRLMPLDLPTIAGNHERQVLTLPIERMSATDAHTARALQPRHRDWLRSLPATRWLDRTAGAAIWCCHGTPDSDLTYWLETVDAAAPAGVRGATDEEARQRLGSAREWAASLVLCGHTHVPRLRQLAGGPLVLNPGSVGLPAYDDDHPSPHHIENGSPHARWALASHTPAGWQIALQATPYDHEAAARRAEQHGRPDWADALRTGRVGRTEAQVLAQAQALARVARPG